MTKTRSQHQMIFPIVALDEDSMESRSILSFALLIAVIVAGFVISLNLAEANPTLTHTLSTILN